MEITEITLTKNEIICLLDMKNESTLIGISFPEFEDVKEKLEEFIGNGQKSLLNRKILLHDDQNKLIINPSFEPLITHLILANNVVFFNIGMKEVGIRNYFFKIIGDQVIEHSITENQTSQIKYIGNISLLFERISELIPLKNPELDQELQKNEIPKPNEKGKEESHFVTYDEAIKKMVNCIQKPVLSVSVAYMIVEKGIAKDIKSMSFLADMSSSWGIFVPEFPNSELEFLIRPVTKKEILNILHNWLISEK